MPGSHKTEAPRREEIRPLLPQDGHHMGIQFATECVFKIRKAEQRKTICPIMDEGSQPVGSKTVSDHHSERLSDRDLDMRAGHGEDLALTHCTRSGPWHLQRSAREGEPHSKQGFVTGRG